MYMINCMHKVLNRFQRGKYTCRLKKVVGSDNILAQFIKIISHYKKMAINTLMYCNRLQA